MKLYDIIVAQHFIAALVEIGTLPSVDYAFDILQRLGVLRLSDNIYYSMRRASLRLAFDALS